MKPNKHDRKLLADFFEMYFDDVDAFGRNFSNADPGL